jgi:hypothetical protein
MITSETYLHLEMLMVLDTWQGYSIQLGFIILMGHCMLLIHTITRLKQWTFLKKGIRFLLNHGLETLLLRIQVLLMERNRYSMSQMVCMLM